MNRKSHALVLAFALFTLCAVNPAAATAWGAAAHSLLTAPAGGELVSFWAKPYPHGYRWRRPPCFVPVWVDTGCCVRGKRARVCR